MDNVKPSEGGGGGNFVVKSKVYLFDLGNSNFGHGHGKKMGIFVAKSRGKILGGPFRPWKI